jgi:glycosyltransferase involved in cell wall biosynthesis
VTIVLHVQKVSGISGSENHLLSLLPGLRARGWDARMLMLHEREPGATEFARELRARDVPVEEMRLRLDLDPLAFGRVTRSVVRTSPRILHSHLVHGDAYGLPAGVFARVPLRVSTKHGFNEFRDHRVFAFGDRAVSRLAQVQIAISRGLADYLAEREGFDANAFEVVHYGIAAGEEPPPYSGGSARLLCVGRLIPIKGHKVLLRAFAAAREDVPELTLDLAGTGPLEEELRRLAGDGVRFRGHVAPVQPLIEESAIVIVPSLGEGFGMVALEAMERGRPVVASSVGGLGEIVADGETGLLVPPGEVEPLRAAIVELARDLPHAAELGRAGRARALAEFSEERCIEGTAALYDEGLAR